MGWTHKVLYRKRILDQSPDSSDEESDREGLAPIENSSENSSYKEISEESGSSIPKSGEHFMSKSENTKVYKARLSYRKQ